MLSRIYDQLKSFTLPRRRRRPDRHRVRLAVTALEERALMSAGVPDLAFGASAHTQVYFDLGAKTDHAEAVALQPDGKIVMAGWVTGPNGDRDFAAARLLPDGTPDSSFGSGGKVRVAFDLGGSKNDMAHAIALQADGKIVLAGEVERSNGDFDMGIVRLNVDGTLDGGATDITPDDDPFSTDGKTTVAFDLGGSKIDIARAVLVRGEKIYVIGDATNATGGTDMAIARLEPDGALDLNFSPGGAGVDGGDGRTTIAFNLGAGAVAHATSAALQANKIVIAGWTLTVNNGADMAVARINADGSLDTTFSPGGTEGNGKATVAFDLGSTKHDLANALVVQPDRKIVVVGTVARANAGDLDFGIARLDADGSPDANFGNNSKTLVAFDRGGTNADQATAVALQADGQIVVAGTVQGSAVAGDTDFALTRLSADGIMNTAYGNGGREVFSFNLGQQFQDDAAGVAIDAAGRAVVVGTVQRSTTNDTDFGIARFLGDPPAVPTVSGPAAPVVVDQATYTIAGTAAAGTHVRLYRDVNQNGQYDAGTDVVVGDQQLTVDQTSYSIQVPLEASKANKFLVTAGSVNGESLAAVVPTITEEGYATKVTKKPNNSSVVVVTGAVSNVFKKVLGPYPGLANVKAVDFNKDGVQDIYIIYIAGGVARVQVYDGKNLARLK